MPQLHRSDDSQANQEQSKLWNGSAGRAWIDEQAVLDETYRRFETLLADEATATRARRVLDVGCGTGATTLALARRIGTGGACTGVDISGPMIAVAREHADRENVPACFIHADAQTHAFEPASFDLIVSRFGVMFFDDPVSAFANLLQAARDGGALRCIVFRSIAENRFMTTAERAAADLIPNLPPRNPEAPGQFAFADPQRVQRILEQAGWTQVDMVPLDVECAFPASELDRYLMRLGPLGIFLQQSDESTRTRVLETVRAAFAPFVQGTEVRFRAACWMVGAEAPR